MGEKAWQLEESNENSLTRHTVNSIFFAPLVHTPKNRTATALRDERWPISVVVDSTSEISWLVNLIRILTTGASTVRAPSFRVGHPPEDFAILAWKA